jgi:hypothetical protein
MPPEASSRSKTYFPKIWGNKRRSHRTAIAGVWLVAGCTAAPRQELRDIRAHWVPGCAPAADAPSTQINLDALGDFDPSLTTHAVLDESTAAAPLTIPVATRAVVADATNGFGEWTGIGDVGDTGDVGVSLWPAGATCPLAASSSYPTQASGQSFGVAPDSGFVLVSGGTTSDATSALAADVDTGVMTVIPSDDGPRTRREAATTTEFGADLLVAGGRDPETSEPLDSADVFDPAALAFQNDRVALESPRADHAAVVLASGETLLVGGVGADGNPVRTLEAISPSTRQYRISGLTDLEVARKNPSALRLSDDRVLVAAGVDASNEPVEVLEWLAADGSRVDQESSALATADEAATTGRAFAAMPGGSVLVVGGCRLLAASEPSCDTPCNGGAGCASDEVLWLTRDGTPTVLPDALDVTAATPLLVAGEEGRPWLLADGANGGRVLRRFNPWESTFVPADTPVTVPQDPTARGVATDPGLLVWLGGENAGDLPSLTAYRHGTRGQFTDAVAPLLLGSTDGLSLDRPLGADVARDPSDGDVLLTAAGATLVLTDTTYADVSVAVDVRAGAPPTISLADRTYGDASCPWPATPEPPFIAELDRIGTEVRLTVASKTRVCAGNGGRVSVSIVGTGETVDVRSVTVRRSIGTP